MKDIYIDKVIKETLKDMALQLFELNTYDKKSILDEYKEWILHDIDVDEVLMLPYEAYTDSKERNNLED